MGGADIPKISIICSKCLRSELLCVQFSDTLCVFKAVNGYRKVVGEAKVCVCGGGAHWGKSTNVVQ